jgi:YVTN family beta-propeller protein
MNLLPLTLFAGLAIFPSPYGSSHATNRSEQPVPTGPYKVLKTVKVGGDGGFDYVYADSSGRKLYIARSGQTGRVSVFDLDTLAPVGEIPNTRAHGVAADAKFSHAFASSKPVAMWDTKSQTPIKTIDVQGNPDGILGDAFNHRIYIFSHENPNVTVIDAKDGSVLGTIEIGGAPEQAASDGKGQLFVDIEDKASVAVIDTRSMKMTGTYSLDGKGEGCAGLALDSKNHVLFVACREPNTMVILNSETGKLLANLPIGQGCDGVVFNPKTHEAFSSQGDGTLTVIKETSPTSFAVEQNVTTTRGAKTCTLDPKTGKIYLIAAEYGPAPESPAQTNTIPSNGPPVRRRPRAPMIPGSFSIWVVGK